MSNDILPPPRRSIGFGIERVGNFALSHKLITWIVLIAITTAAMVMMPRLKFDSDFMRMYEGSGEQFSTFDDVRQKFGMFETDLFIFVRSDDLTQPERLQAARMLAEEFALTSKVAATLSPFSLRLPQPDGGTSAALPLGLDTPEKVRNAYETMYESLPLAENLINADFTQITLVVMPDLSDGVTTAQDTYRELLEAKAYLDENFEEMKSVEVIFGGQPVWLEQLLNAAGDDQLRLNVVGAVISLILALVVFRHPLLAGMVLITPFIIATWAMAITVFMFGAITFFTMVLATLMMMLSFAESIYFVRTWQLQKRAGFVGKEAIFETMRIVYPATVLSMATTSLAFLSLTFAPGRGIFEFAIGGAVSTGFALFGLMSLLPLLLHTVDRFLPASMFTPSKPNETLQNFLTTVISRFSRPVALGGVVIVVLLLAPYANIKPVFSIHQLIPKDLLNSQPSVGSGNETGVGGIAPVYVTIKLDDDGENVSLEEFNQIKFVGQVMEEEVGAGQVLSLAQFGEFGSTENIKNMLQNLGPNLSNRFITSDGKEAMMTGFSNPNSTSSELRAALGKLSERLEEAGIDASLPTGFRVLTTYESENLIDQMEISLFTAMIATIFIIGLAFGEFRMMILTIVPNLFPVLAVVAYQYFFGIGQTMTSVIALTIAFGVAVNDTIHLLNTYRHYRQQYQRMEAIIEAITHVGKSMITTTAILGAGIFATLFSNMPQVNSFGQLFVAAMGFALIGDLIFLPAIIAATKREQIRRRKA